MRPREPPRATVPGARFASSQSLRARVRAREGWLPAGRGLASADLGARAAGRLRRRVKARGSRPVHSHGRASLGSGWTCSTSVRRRSTTERLHAIRRPAGPARCDVAAANLGACEPDALRTWTVAKMVSRGLAPVAARPRATPRKRKTRRSCRRAPDTASSLSVLDSQHSRTCQIRHRQWSRGAENVARNHGPPADGLRFRRPGRCAGTRKVQGWRASAAGNKSIRWMI